MRILVVGASGFIGSAIASRLRACGHEVVAVSRRPPATATETVHLALDVSQQRTPGDWLSHLQGIDAAVYCAGALQDSPGESLEGVHHAAAACLFEVCAAAGVRRVILFSAIGVDLETRTAFSATKAAGEQALMRSQLDWVILRPSVVIGRGAYGGSALLRGLAALPVLPVPADAGALEPVMLDDVVDTVLHFLKPGASTRVALDLAGPDAMPIGTLVGRFRRWLGWRPAPSVALPRALGSIAFRLGDLAGWFGWRSAIRSTARCGPCASTKGRPRCTEWWSPAGSWLKDDKPRARGRPRHRHRQPFRPLRGARCRATIPPRRSASAWGGPCR